jgi:DNA primase
MHIPRLHPDTIEEVKQRADIVDVISEHVVLRKRGKDFVGLCPFHDEKTPSFSVSPSKQMYYCFGCHATGNAIKFLMEIGKRPFTEVVLDLARRYQLPVKTLLTEQRQELQRQLSLREVLYEILGSAAQFYQHALRHSGTLALEYLCNSRQLKEETIQQFGLGYAPAGWETLYRYLVQSKRYPVQLVEQAGLIKPRSSGGGYYDVFRDRLMIPICDVQGRIIAFGGRTLKDEQPKYLNSPETELFNKGKTLFALDKAKSAISREDKAIVVEGYFDVITLHEKGITNAVASLGTALSLEQVRQLLRYSESKELILNFDADKAGTNAAERAIGEIANLAYRGEVQLKILNIPDGKDADEYLHTYSAENYRQLLINSPLWIDWQIQQILAGRDLKLATQFQQVSQALVKLLKNIENSDTRSYYISHCAEILSLGDARLVPLRAENLVTQLSVPKSNSRTQLLVKPKQQPHAVGAQESFTPGEPKLLEESEALLLQLYLHCLEHRQAVVDTLEERDLQFSLSHHRFLWRQIVEMLPETALQQDDLISRLQDKCLEFPEQMALVSPLFHLNEKTQKELLRGSQVIQAATAAMEIVVCEKRYRHFLELHNKTDAQAEPERYDYYYQAFIKEKQRMQELDKLRQFPMTQLS